MATSSRSLADDIRARTDAQLVDLVLARPDLARPSPADLTSLAARSGTRASVQRAIEALDRGHLQVLEALVVAGDGASVDDLAALLGGADASVVASHLGDRWTSALVWRSAEGEHVVRTVPEVLGSSVAGLGAPLHELRPDLASRVPGPEQLRQTIEQAPADARTMLEKMTWGPALGVLPTGGPGRTTARWLIEHHLLLPVSVDRVTLPREVGLVLREGRLHRTPQLEPPATARRVRGRWQVRCRSTVARRGAALASSSPRPGRASPSAGRRRWRATRRSRRSGPRRARSRRHRRRALRHTPPRRRTRCARA